MKLFRFGEPTNEKTGVILSDGKKIDVSAFGEDYNENFFANNGIERLSIWLRTNADDCPSVADDVRLASCVARPSKIICIGLNYAKHALESSMPKPTEPVVFFKSTTALCGPNDDVIIPKNSVKTDWEVELAFVIGKKASYIEKDDAMSYIAGYCLHNDYSEREFQLERGGQWVKGKSCDTFAPLGPFLATIDEVGEVIIIRNLSSAVYLNFGATSNTFNVDGQLLLSSDSKTLIEQQQLTLNGFSAVIIQTS